MERGLVGAPRTHSTGQWFKAEAALTPPLRDCLRGWHPCRYGDIPPLPGGPAGVPEGWAGSPHLSWIYHFLPGPLSPFRFSSITLPIIAINSEAWWVVVVAILLSSLIELPPYPPLPPSPLCLLQQRGLKL